MSSRSNKLNLAPTSPARTTKTPAPKGSRDAPPASKGRHATSATTERDDDPLSSQGERDAPSAKQDRYATPATPGREVESTKSSIRHSPLPQRRSSSATIRGSKSPTSESATTV